jgi:catechol 2,3-dioxygenase-like lactoylglutathione lyase family enzyme
MFDHVMLKVKDLKASKRFYTAALAPLGFSVQYDADGMVGFGPKDAPALWLAEGESAGGKDNGEPGLRPQYHANYYGGFVKDPDGNNIEAVSHQEE